MGPSNTQDSFVVSVAVRRVENGYIATFPGDHMGMEGNTFVATSSGEMACIVEECLDRLVRSGLEAFSPIQPLSEEDKNDSAFMEKLNKALKFQDG